VIFFAVLKYLGPIKKATRAKKDETTLSTTDQPK
jgi:hypothetical protein